MTYASTESSSIKEKKAAFWMLAKILKSNQASILNTKFKIVEYIHNAFICSTDFGFKGSICYIFSYVATNSIMKKELVTLGWTFFNNRDIAFPSKMELLIGSEIKDDNIFETSNMNAEKMVQKYTKLDSNDEELYNQMCLLLNTITYKQAYSKLRESFKPDSNSCMDPKLLIRVISLLSKYKYQQQLRQFIFSITEPSLSNVPLMEKTRKLMESIGDNLF